MTEAASWTTPQQLRELLVMLLVHCEVLSPLKLWNAFWKFMSEDIVYQQRRQLNFMEYVITDLEVQTYTFIEISCCYFSMIRLSLNIQIYQKLKNVLPHAYLTLFLLRQNI